MDYYTKILNDFDEPALVLPAWDADEELNRLRKENGELRLMVVVLKQVIKEHKEIIAKSVKVIGEKGHETF